MLLAACTAGADPAHRVPVHDRYEPPASVPRLAWEPVTGYDGSADDFLLLGDTLVVLDERAAEVALLVREVAPDGVPERWRRVHAFGRRGSGPGELRMPSGIANAGPGQIWLWDEVGRLNRFSLDGRLASSHRLSFPCRLFFSAIASDSSGLYVAGNCADGLGPKDTVHARAFVVRDDSIASEVASAPVTASDFSWGSILTARRLVTEGRRGAIFATGLDGCLTMLAGEPSRRCTDPPARYRSPISESLRDARMPNGARPRWPDPITPLFAHLDGDPPYIVQLISDDSVVVTRWAVGELPRLVGPANAFVACRVDHCLWFDDREARLALVSTADLAQATEEER